MFLMLRRSGFSCGVVGDYRALQCLIPNPKLVISRRRTYIREFWIHSIIIDVCASLSISGKKYIRDQAYVSFQPTRLHLLEQSAILQHVHVNPVPVSSVSSTWQLGRREQEFRSLSFVSLNMPSFREPTIHVDLLAREFPSRRTLAWFVSRLQGSY